MKTILVVLAIVAFANSTVTQKQVLSAINWCRTEPKNFAAYVKATYLDKGVKGVSGDENCYQECHDVMNAQSPLSALKENPRADVVAWKHSKDLAEQNYFSHTSKDGRSPGDRLKAEDQWTTYNENIAYTGGKPDSTHGTEFTVMWVCDCRVLSRGHRKNILTTSAPEIGVGIYRKDSSVYATTNGVNAGFASGKECTANEKTAMNAEGDLHYAGKGANQVDITATAADGTLFGGASSQGNNNSNNNNESSNTDNTNTQSGQSRDGIYKSLENLNGANFQASKGDGSAQCPQTKCPNGAKVLKEFTRLTGQCDMNKAPFNGANAYSEYPFAHDKKCYRAYLYCVSCGALWAKYYEYTPQGGSTDTADVDLGGLTLKQAAEQALKTNGDGSATCPGYPCSGKIKKTVTPYFNTNEACATNQGGFDAQNFRVKTPVAFKKLCFGRWDYCLNGKIYRQDMQF